jgi:predicted O-methyltransferase YrrM
MTPERWAFLSNYAVEVAGAQDEHLAGLGAAADTAGLPDWAVTPDVGHFLKLLVGLTPGKVAIELGTLAGYSAIWIARGMAPDGMLYTIEFENSHADFAERQFVEAGVDDRIELVRGAALDVLPDLRSRLGDGSVDFVFIDAIKEEYSDYFVALRPMMKKGGLVVADNVYGTGAGWIDEGFGTDEFNRLVAADPDFETAITPMREGILIARRSTA